MLLKVSSKKMTSVDKNPAEKGNRFNRVKRFIKPPSVDLKHYLGLADVVGSKPCTINVDGSLNIRYRTD